MNISSLVPTSIPSLNTAASESQAKDLSSLKSLAVGSKSPADVEASAPQGLQERRQAALSLVDRTLAMAYEKISSRGKSAVEAYQEVEPLTPNKVASNILGFIERRLQMDVAEGATQEELQSRLEAGLAGYKKGFAEASEQLKALSMLSPEIAADIGETNDLVLKGIDDLRSKFIKAVDQPQTDVPAAKADQVVPEVAKQVVKSSGKKSEPDLLLPTLLSGVNAASLRQGNYEYASASQFSFELTTAEGDKVTIKASASLGMSVRQGAGDTSSSESMSFQVEGDLSDVELKAINDLLGHVNDLAEQFFSGNLDEAFNQALNLGYDETQIATFALDLAQVEIEQVVPDEAAVAIAAAEQAALAGDQPVALPDELYPLGNFIKTLLASLDIPAHFSDSPQSLFISISSSMISVDEEGKVQAERFTDFVKGIFALELGQTSDETSVAAADKPEAGDTAKN